MISQPEKQFVKLIGTELKRLYPVFSIMFSNLNNRIIDYGNVLKSFYYACNVSLLISEKNVLHATSAEVNSHFKPSIRIKLEWNDIVAIQADKFWD